MVRLPYILFFVFSFFLLLLLCLAQEEKRVNQRCPSFPCGFLGDIRFPFSNRTHPECGLLIVDNCTEDVQKIQLRKDGPWFNVAAISQDNMIQLYDKNFEEQLKNCSPKSLKTLSLPISPFLSFNVPYNQSAFQCPSVYALPKNFSFLCKNSLHSYIFYSIPSGHFPSSPPRCSPFNYRVNKTETIVEYSNLFTGRFNLEVNVTDECYHCFFGGGQCQADSKGNFECSVPGRTNSTISYTQRIHITNYGNGKSNMKLRLGIGIGVGGSILIVALSVFINWRRKKQKYASTSFNSRNSSSDPSSRSDLEVGGVYFEVPIFSYSELAKATNNFSDEKVLGNGGFGTVYYAKLRDGREVAVKRLNENNYKRVNQFMNEVKILTRLRHGNLVSLYGCTSQHSQQGLLLVYEYVSNGTVADHLRGDLGKPGSLADHLRRDLEKPGSLAWPIRMKIAIETASALAYLHASDTIHRDVKTKNILLDNNFCVKVADFGLSRFFPADVTHVSTAPQGSPGYVDPEYYHCYQLTDWSDVYSFGVVLIELISSMPAIDKKRNRHEINLGYFAINRIQKGAIEELVDPRLGYLSNKEVRRMTTLVAELAFLCLQQNKEMRPPMVVVLDELKRIESGEWKLEDVKEEKDNNDVLNSMEPPPDCDDLALLKDKRVSSSPISVAAKWVSSSTRLNVSY
ncbi:LEAF RUST 10 DISEASE-RESISTANCE LOCUS RECEPTOR-LIKE PROTEIN KINASE-like 1.1 isoform X2 [Pistacia vera]|uniref:LEAF RUST 10 DISEASE-RESISTANCE LOCUS RECEPTOR-LIKE PROTEIN KINASE-like 1.1 isoform X2 n=1 Tax=Pistacia vera TaxID=55513 RepID=UPI001262F4F8|nr:LEAF RUST 10 DISEASE-RESISTANCE LOCUS RECEPTOR-LIKE PROTEIN KINASE-like 1.1 isoform X2 [Pistacia vera]